MTCIVVDDEPLAREGMLNLIEEVANLEILGTFNHAAKAEQFIKNTPVDIIFLDIEMPGSNGLEFARTIPKSSFVIFTTAYAHYALESYEVDAIDYLVKPILSSRFKKAVNKVSHYQSLLNAQKNTLEKITHDYLFIKSERRFHKVFFNTILFIEGLKDYVVIHIQQDKVITAMNLKTIHKKLPENFIRVSKSYIVNDSHIQSFDTNTIYINKHEIPIGKVFQKDFQKKYLGKELS